MIYTAFISFHLLTILLSHITLAHGFLSIVFYIRSNNIYHEYKNWIFFLGSSYDDVIKWMRFPRYWPFVWGIHRSPVNYPHKGQWRGALMLSLICEWINRWVYNREAGDLRRHRTHYGAIVMNCLWFICEDYNCICTSKCTENWY